MPNAPIRLMPETLNFPNTNRAISAYRAEQEFQGQEADREETVRARKQERDTDEAIRRALEANAEPPSKLSDVVSSMPRSQPPSDVVGVTDGYETDTMPPMSAPAPPPAVSRTPVDTVASPRPKLSSISSAPLAAPASAPAGGGTARGSVLDRINSLDQSVISNLTPVNPREALKVKSGAMSRDLGEIERQNAKELEVLKMAAGGDVDGAATLAQQNGLDIDPRILGNAQMVEAGVITGETAKALGANHDDAWMERFMQNFMQTRDAQAAVKAAGRPSARPKKAGSFKPQILEQNGKRTVGAFNTQDGTVTDTGLGAPAAAGGAGGGSVREISLMNFLVDKGVVDGATPEEKFKNAAKWVQTAKVNPNARTNMIVSAAARLAANPDFARAAKRGGKDAMSEATRQIQSAISQADSGAGVFMYDVDEGGSQRRVMSTDGGRTYYYTDNGSQYVGEFDTEEDESEDEEN